MIAALEAGNAEIILIAPATIANVRKTYEDKDERQSRWASVDLTEHAKKQTNTSGVALFARCESMSR